MSEDPSQRQRSQSKTLENTNDKQQRQSKRNRSSATSNRSGAVRWDTSNGDGSLSGANGTGQRPSFSRQRGGRQSSIGPSGASNPGDSIAGGTMDGRQSQYRQVSGQRDNANIKAELDARIRCPARRLAGSIIDNPYVKVIILFLIVANGITMGIATFGYITDSPKRTAVFEIIDFSFLLLFTFELCLQWLYRGWTLWKDGWLIFDFVIITLSWAFEGLAVVRAFRIFRALRLIGQLGPLRQLVLAIGTTLPRLQSIGCLLFLDVYVFAVLFTELWRDVGETEKYFSSLPRAAFTCIEMMTLEDWGGVVRDLYVAGYWYATIIVGIFMALTGFIVFNLIVAVVCDAVYMIHEHIRWLDGKDDESDSEFMDQILAEEEIPERMAALVLKIKTMVEFQTHLDKLLLELVTHMKNMDILKEDFDMSKVHRLVAENTVVNGRKSGSLRGDSNNPKMLGLNSESASR